MRLVTILAAAVIAFSTASCRQSKPKTTNANTEIAAQQANDPAASAELERAAQDVQAFKQESQRDLRKAEIDPADQSDLAFGRIYPASSAQLQLDNPHAVAAYAVRQCIAARGATLAVEMKHVESDPDLGRAFENFIAEFCPDLERYRAAEIAVRFDGYALNPTTSVWYYSLTDLGGQTLPGSPWVSLHRSRASRRCALTGIFLPDTDGEIADPMPADLIRTAV